MLRNIIFLAISVSVVNGFYITSDNSKNCIDKSEMRSVNETTNYGALNPDGQMLPFERLEIKRAAQYRYTLGERINGDRLLAQGSDSQSFLTPQRIEVMLSYPMEGNSPASTVTFVDIMVVQTSDQGDSYVIDGGINQAFIKILLEALETTSFDYSASFYGY